MGFPNLKNKHAKDSMFNPKEYLAYMKKVGKYPKFKPPVGVIFCYQRKLMEHILEKHKVTKVKLFYGDTYLLNESKGRIAVVGNFGIGAPVVATLLEELIAFGVKKFISIGTAGTLQKDIKIGSLMVCEKAIRDEGTSHHYLKHSKYAFASKNLTSDILLELAGQSMLHIEKLFLKPNNIKKSELLLLRWRLLLYLQLLNIGMLNLEQYLQ